MRRLMPTILASFCGFVTACGGTPIDQGDDDYNGYETADEIRNQELDIEGLSPFHVAVFDHIPTSEEIEAELNQAALDGKLEGSGEVSQLVSPIGGSPWPAPGQKRVTISATTGNISNAGTDGRYVYFGAYWQAQTGSGQQYQYYEQFVLDNSSVDDLNRNTTSVFHYIVNLNNYAYGTTQDRFIKGKIRNTSTDAWFCQSLNVVDMNNLGNTRTQSLPFGQWVDSPSPQESNWMFGNDTKWLFY